MKSLTMLLVAAVLATTACQESTGPSEPAAPVAVAPSFATTTTRTPRPGSYVIPSGPYKGFTCGYLFQYGVVLYTGSTAMRDAYNLYCYTYTTTTTPTTSPTTPTYPAPTPTPGYVPGRTGGTRTNTNQ